MSLVENTAGRWFKLSVFGELGLNNVGRLEARENRKVLCKVRRKPVQRRSSTSSPGCLTEYPRAGGGRSRSEERRAHRRAAKKQAQSKNDLL